MPAHVVAADWDEYLDMPDSWYAADDGRAVLTNVLARQRDCGGWDKNYDPMETLSPEQIEAQRGMSATIDNDATIGELQLLAKAFSVTSDVEAKAAFDRGLAYLFEAQYGNGGWPQYYPLVGGYHDAITYNDDAMNRVVAFMRKVAEGQGRYQFVPQDQRAQAQASYENGVRAMLDTQVEVDGQLTAWCAQHDAETLKPTMARAYEHPSLSGSESVHIIRLLMSIDEPSDEIIRAVQSAVAWLERVKIPGVSYERVELPDGTRDRLLLETGDPDEVWWARFYEVGTNRPIFSGRDSVVRYRLDEVELERRQGYAWYSRRAETLLNKDYPAWQQKWAPGHNVLEATRAHQ